MLDDDTSAASAPDTDTAAKPAAKKTATKKTAVKTTVAKKTTAKKTTAKKTTAKKTTAKKAAAKKTTAKKAAAKKAAANEPAVPIPLFKPADPTDAPPVVPKATPAATVSTAEGGGDEQDGTGTRRRRRRGGRRRHTSDDTGEGTEQTEAKGDQTKTTDDDKAAAEVSEGGTSSSRRRRRRHRKGEPADPGDDPGNTVVKVRERRSAEAEIKGVEGSTRLAAKKQRRKEGRESGRRRPPILSESEFLARRESVQREMVVRQREGLIQIAVLEDNVLVEHYVARESQTSLIGNVYQGRVQNVLPSMEAAFIDIGKGRNAVLYAGEVDWKALGMDGKPRRVEEALSSGQHVLVQVTKDPVGHKGARLTGQISLPGRFLVYVPNGHTSGISRKLHEGERARLKALTKDVVPEDAGVIIRTAAEGATEEQLTRDVTALTARWEDISAKASDKGKGPTLLYGEPDLMIKVIRDLFTEDFARLVVQGDDAWEDIQNYVGHVAPDLSDRVQRHEGDDDAFAAHRVDEQIAKALERKVFLPSGGSLVIDRTEAMTVVDVNTGKFTGAGGNLEETVTKNNLEAAEEIVRQLRLRDIGGIIVADFIDMVLEDNRDLVLRRLVECLSRDRTRHQVAEVTSLGLVQMTRKKIGTGLVEVFSEPCDRCGGRGLILHSHPVEPAADKGADDKGRRGRRRGAGSGGRDKAKSDETSKNDAPDVVAPTKEPTKQEPPTDEAPKQVPEAAAPTSEPVVPVQLGEAITPKKRARKRVTRKAAPPAPTPADV